MQRFKNLTKKSGKVASAILSAAMVTSMVLGTNVVEVKAAETETEVTIDVKAGSDAQVAKANAVADTLTAQLDKLKDKVNSSTANDSGAKASTIKAFNDAVQASVTQDVTIDDNDTLIKMATADAPTATKEGKIIFTAKLKVKKSNSDETEQEYPYTYTYTIPSNEERAESVADEFLKAVIEKAKGDTATYSKFAAFYADPSDNGTYADARNDLATAATAVASDVDTDTGLKKYGDLTLTAETLEGKTADAKNPGKIHAKAAVNCNGSTASAKYDETTKSLDQLKTEAIDLAKQVVLVDEEAADTNAVGSPSNKVEDAINQYLKDHGSAYKVDTTASTNEFSIDYNKVASDTTDGSAVVTFKLTDGTTTTDKIENTYVVTNKTKYLQDRADEVAAAAEKVDPEKVFTKAAGTVLDDLAGNYATEFAKAYNENNKAYLGDAKINSTDTVTATAGKATFNQYATEYKTTTLNVTLSQTTDNDKNTSGDYIAIFEVTRSGDTKRVTATIGAPTTLSKTTSAVSDALDKATITNSTTKEDVAKIATDAAKAVDPTALVDVSIVDKTTATSDAAGSLTVEVKVTVGGKDNIITKTLPIAKLAPSGQFVEKDGKKFYYDKDGKLLKNTFLQGTDSPDGYTYYIQNDGSVMQDRLTYHPNGKDVIYFDAEGHEVFDAFVNVKKDVQGNAVDYIGYFGTLGGAYVNQTTYGNGVGAYSKDALFYINDYGVLENKGWFQNAAGNIGYAAANGTLTTNQWGLDQFGRKVYFQANGFLAKGLMTDGVKTYQLDETDGHLVGEF